MLNCMAWEANWNKVMQEWDDFTFESYMTFTMAWLYGGQENPETDWLHVDFWYISQYWHDQCCLPDARN